MKNEQAFKESMVLFGEIFDKKVSPEILKIYWDILTPYTDEQFSTAVAAHNRTGRFFPRPADLISLIEGTSQANAQEAWGEVMNQIRDSANASFDKPTTRAVAAIGGAEYLGTMSYRDLEFKKKDFIDIYESLDDADPTPRIETGKSQIDMVNDLVKKVTDDTTRNSDDENDKDP